MLESFHFLRPAALLLVPVAVGIWWLWQRRSDPLRGWRAQVEPELLAALAGQGSSLKNRQSLVLTAWLLAILAIAGPSWLPEPSPFAEDATPLIVLFKVDTSMDTPDPEPSRTERAHLKIKDLARERKGQLLSLIAYAGSAHLVLPPTKDTAAVATMAAEVSPEIMPVPGDRLDLAITQAGELLQDTGGTLLVITDTAITANAALSESYKSAGSPFTQILAIAAPESSIEPIQPVAKLLKAEVIAMTADDSDIDHILAKARRAPLAQAEDGEIRWQDGGYFLVPVIACLALFPFRQESSPDTTA